ncbi:MAG: helix-turn-helix transcriptional regulator [Eubacteriaceae bacterium]|jgi:DNA-binding CsgD family transcriptional regulator|nr:helix-turn-helix transcriptional regulator [Eubacteriaceae bacterium]
MSFLTSEDYINVGKFFAAINKDYDDFDNTTLNELEQIFGYTYTTYAIFDIDENGENYVRSIISHSLSEFGLEKYKKEAYKTDPFFLNINKLRTSEKGAYVYTNADLPDVDIESLEYGKLLASSGLYYEALLGCNGSFAQTEHCLCIYKSREDGMFTRHELDLFQLIGWSFYESLILYTNYMNCRKILDTVEYYTESMDFAFCIIDSLGHVVRHNQSYLAYGADISGKHSLGNITDYFLQMFRDPKAGTRSGHMRIETNGDYTISLLAVPVKYLSEYEFYSVITISKADVEMDSKQQKLDLIMTYNLTAREAEVAILILEGYDNTKIMETLFISKSTVKTHIRNIFLKIGVSSRMELIRKLS